MMGLWGLKHVEERANPDTVYRRKRIVYQIGNKDKLYWDARSKKNIKKSICWGTNFLSPLPHCTFLFSIRSEILLLFEDVIFNYWSRITTVKKRPPFTLFSPPPPKLPIKFLPVICSYLSFGLCLIVKAWKYGESIKAFYEHFWEPYMKAEGTSTTSLESAWRRRQKFCQSSWGVKEGFWRG
jgi:hypothetical protein